MSDDLHYEGTPDEIIAHLKRDLRTERTRNKQMAEELRQMREAQVALQAQTEQEEEFLTNTLMKKMEQIQKEKDKLAVQVETEEEYLTNTLMKKLDQLRKEKVDLENQLEQEEEYIVNKLQKQLDQVVAEKKALENRLEHESEGGAIQVRLQRELETIRNKVKEYEQELGRGKQRNERLKDELKTLKTENFLLAQKVHHEHELLTHVSSEKTKLASQLDLVSESRFNSWRHNHPAPSSSSSGSLQVVKPASAGTLSPASAALPANQRPRSKSHLSVFPVKPKQPPRSPQLAPQAAVLKEQWCQVLDKEADRWVRSFLVLYSNGELCVYVDEAKALHLLTINLDTVTDVKPSKATLPPGTVGAVIDLVTPSETCIINLDSDTQHEWLHLLTDLSPKGSV